MPMSKNTGNTNEAEVEKMTKGKELNNTEPEGEDNEVELDEETLGKMAKRTTARTLRNAMNPHYHWKIEHDKLDKVEEEPKLQQKW